MPDAIFAHSRLAPIYDAFDGAREDLDAYLAIIEEFGADRILDIGCGTGNLAVLLAGRGHTVAGIDPAAESLEVAKSKDPTGKITWIHGDGTKAPKLNFDLAVLTGNVAQVFLTPEDWASTLGGIHDALRPEGYLVFEIRRPEYRAWEGWARAAPMTLDLPEIGKVTQTLRVTEIKLPYVSFRYTYHFEADGAQVTSDSTLWFRDRTEIETSLTECGYTIQEIREAPDRPNREYVFITKRET